LNGKFEKTAFPAQKKKKLLEAYCALLHWLTNRESVRELLIKNYRNRASVGDTPNVARAR